VRKRESEAERERETETEIERAVPGSHMKLEMVPLPTTKLENRCSSSTGYRIQKRVVISIVWTISSR
jgi:hypothetical protein